MGILAEDNITLTSQKTVNDKAEEAKTIAEDTAQYFWVTETGTDTGAHITEVTKEEFLDDPSNGGGNLLARSNGIAVRDGLNELATFSADGITMKDSEQNEIFDVSVRSGNITHILRYGYKSSNGYGGVINLGRAINTFTSISVTYHGIADTPADAVTETWNSLPVSVHISDTDEYGFYVEQVNSSTLDINFFSVDADGFGSLIVDNFTINYTTTQITTEVDVGAYPDTTLTAPLRIGNGTANNAKSNAFIVDWAGNGLFAGNDIRYGCNADSSGGKSLIHGDMINGYYYVAQDDSEYVFDVYRIGHIVTVLCQCTKTASVSAGGNIFTGVVNGSYGRIPKPAMDYATGAGFYSSCVIGAFMYPDDDYLRILIRNITGGTLPAGVTVYVSLTYATNE